MAKPEILIKSKRQQPCDLCAGEDFRIVSRRDRQGQSLMTVVCAGCGLVSHEQIPSDDELQAYYQAQYRQDYHGEWKPAPHRVLRAWESGQWLLRTIRPFLQPGQRVLEIGAGIGCTVRAFQLAGFDASGIEPGIGFQTFADQQLGARIQRKTWAELPPVPEYDLVLMVHVIEHLNSPRRALQHIHRLLRPHGYLYVECPNVAAPHAAPSKLFHYAHVYNFTPLTLPLLAESCGFRVRQQLADSEDRNLRFLLQRSESGTVVRGEDRYALSYEQTIARLFRFNMLTYHLRPSYLATRLLRDVRFLSHRFLSRRRMQRILQQCRQQAVSSRHEDSTSAAA